MAHTTSPSILNLADATNTHARAVEPSAMPRAALPADVVDGLEAASRHQKDIDHAVAMVISARRSLAAWLRGLRGLCKLDSTFMNAVAGAGIDRVFDADGREYFAISLEPVASAVASAGKDGGL